MQFQPTGFPPPGILNYGQPCAFTPPFAAPQFNGYPEIIGEGTVTTIISPDGSTQYIFTPTSQWWRSCPPNPNTGNFNNLGVWMVRSIYGPPQPTFFSQPIPYGMQYPRPSTSDCCLNLTAPNFPLKFHNDNCTSTSDIHYFIPKQFNRFQYPSRCASVQVECPAPITTDCHPEDKCTKLCNCTFVEPCCCTTKHKERVNRKKSNTSNSAMSIEQSKSDLNCQKRGKKSRKLKKPKSKRPVAKCECVNYDDKSVTTYADKSIDCSPEKGQETQTFCDTNCTGNTVVRKVNKKELQGDVVQRTYAGKTDNNMSSTSTVPFKGNWASTSCSCDSETEME